MPSSSSRKRKEPSSPQPPIGHPICCAPGCEAPTDYEYSCPKCQADYCTVACARYTASFMCFFCVHRGYSPFICSPVRADWASHKLICDTEELVPSYQRRSHLEGLLASVYATMALKVSKVRMVRTRLDEVPKDVCRKLFSFLPPADLMSCCLLPEWLAAASADELWLPHLRSRFGKVTQPPQPALPPISAFHRFMQLSVAPCSVCLLPCGVDRKSRPDASTGAFNAESGMQCEHVEAHSPHAHRLPRLHRLRKGKLFVFSHSFLPPVRRPGVRSLQMFVRMRRLWAASDRNGLGIHPLLPLHGLFSRMLRRRNGRL